MVLDSSGARQDFPDKIDRSFASVGVFLMLIGLTIDPLSQQLISYTPQSLPRPAVNATVGLLREWNETTQRGVVGTLGTGARGSSMRSLWR